MIRLGAAKALRTPLHSMTTKFLCKKKSRSMTPQNSFADRNLSLRHTRSRRNKYLIVRTIILSLSSINRLAAQPSPLHLSFRAQPLEKDPKAPVSRPPHRSRCVSKLHLLSNTDTFSTLDHLPRLIVPTKAALLSAFLFNNNQHCLPEFQLPHRTLLPVLPSSTGEESLRQSPRLIGAESVRPP